MRSGVAADATVAANWPLWLAFGIIALAFLALMAVVVVVAVQGKRLIEKGAMIEKVVTSFARGTADGVASAVSNATRSTASSMRNARSI